MKRSNRLASVLAVAVLAVGMAGPALATVKKIDGGTWDYGTGSGRVWSYYYHGSKCHGSSVTGASGLVRSPDTRAGSWSYASDRDTIWVDHAYYRFC